MSAATKRCSSARSAEALANVKVLKGLLPICAPCKKIRDDNGYWNQIEAYIRDTRETNFSHGIRPDRLNEALPRLRSSARRRSRPRPADRGPTRKLMKNARASKRPGARDLAGGRTSIPRSPPCLAEPRSSIASCESRSAFRSAKCELPGGEPRRPAGAARASARAAHPAVALHGTGAALCDTSAAGGAVPALLVEVPRHLPWLEPLPLPTFLSSPMETLRVSGVVSVRRDLCPRRPRCDDRGPAAMPRSAVEGASPLRNAPSLFRT